MIQKVSSSEQLQELDYHGRGDGTADIRIRKNIKQVTHEATDQTPAWSEWTAIESYQVLPLQEQEAVEQADMLFEGDVTSSQPVALHSSQNSRCSAGGSGSNWLALEKYTTA